MCSFYDSFQIVAMSGNLVFHQILILDVLIPVFMHTANINFNIKSDL